jgi:hypothetical protein
MCFKKAPEGYFAVFISVSEYFLQEVKRKHTTSNVAPVSTLHWLYPIHKMSYLKFPKDLKQFVEPT